MQAESVESSAADSSTLTTIQHIRVALITGEKNCVHPFKRTPPTIPRPCARLNVKSVTGAWHAYAQGDFFRELVGFDEGYLHGSEDIDLCLKVRKQD